MGYCSDVQFAIRGPIDEMTKVWVMFRLNNPYEGSDDPLGKGHLVLREADDQMIIGFRAGGWKWYESYPDIQRVEALWGAYVEAAGEDGAEIDGRFIRLGEDDDDVEDRVFGEGWELMNYYRSVEPLYPFDPDLDVRSKL